MTRYPGICAAIPSSVLRFGGHRVHRPALSSAVEAWLLGWGTSAAFFNVSLR
jgi:hypothetical protein